MENVRWSQHLHGPCASRHFTLSFLQDFSAASQDLGWRDKVCTAKLLTYRFMTDLPGISGFLITDTVFSVVAWHFSNSLKQTNVKLISQADCKSESYYGDLITKNMFCAGSPDWSTDACSVSMNMCACVHWERGCSKNPQVLSHVCLPTIFSFKDISLKADLKSTLFPVRFVVHRN